MNDFYMYDFLYIQEEPKSRKPVGGVSMFGGLDPFANKLKKAGEKTEEKLPVKKPEAKKAGTMSTCEKQIPLTGKAYTNKIVPDQGLSLWQESIYKQNSPRLPSSRENLSSGFLKK